MQVFAQWVTILIITILVSLYVIMIVYLIVDLKDTIHNLVLILFHMKGAKCNLVANISNI